MAKLKMKTHPAMARLTRVWPPPSPFDSLPVGTPLAVASPHADDTVYYGTFLSHDWASQRVYVAMDRVEGYSVDERGKRTPFKRPPPRREEVFDTASYIFALA